MLAHFIWNANSEPDLAGYKLHAGRATGIYDAVGLPKDMGNVTAGFYDIGTNYGAWFFALTAYNTGALISNFSSEVSGIFDVDELIAERRMMSEPM